MVTKYYKISQLFLTGLALIYLVAFSSLYLQFPGLYGKAGLEPIHVLIPKSPLQSSISLFQQFIKFPSIFHLQIPLDPDVLGDVVCLLGMVISALLFVGFLRCTFSYAIIWILYLSLVNVGQTFMSFQWDILLLEIGFVGIWMAPLIPGWMSSRNCSVALLQLRFVLFKLMLMSGVVKIQANCPTWLNLTACHYHFATQCIPTPIAWYFHQLPGWFQKLQVAGTFLIEIPATLLILTPWRSTRILAAILQLLLQSFIIVTGNYNFFNLLTMLLCLTLFDDSILPTSSKIQKGKSEIYENKQKEQLSRWFNIGSIDRPRGFINEFVMKYWLIGLAVAIAYLVMSAFKMFKIGDGTISLTMSVMELNGCLVAILPSIVVIWGGVMLAYGIDDVVKTVYRRQVLAGLWKTIVVFTILTVYMKGILNIMSLERRLVQGASKWPLVEQLHHQGRSWHLNSGYGLFRRMTGVGDVSGLGAQVQRPEIIIEGSADGIQWIPFEFAYKPGNLAQSPPWVAPHQPRLDWQMWFAALGSYNSNHWFIHLIYRLLKGSQAVYDLLGQQIFTPNQPPKYIRANLYYYEFTKASWGRERLSPWGDELVYNHSNQNWWTRVHVREYFHAIQADDVQITNFLKQKKWLGSKSGMGTILRKYRKQRFYLDKVLSLVEVLCKTGRNSQLEVVLGIFGFLVCVYLLSVGKMLVRYTPKKTVKIQR